MKIFLPLLLMILLSGCSTDQKITPSETGNNVYYKKLTMRQIDSLTAVSNYSFTQQNRHEAEKKTASLN